jgi:hypothetical protein
MSKSTNGRIAVCLLVLLGLCASSCVPVTSSRSRFQLHIFRDGWYELQLGHEREQAWTKLKKLGLSDSALVITEDDVEQYDWGQHAITLTAAASNRLYEVFTETGVLSVDLSDRAFIVTFDREWLYGGIFLDAGSAMVIEYPVIYTWPSEGSVVLFLRPNHQLSGEIDPAYRSVIEIPKLHDFFLEQGKLTE